MTCISRFNKVEVFYDHYLRYYNAKNKEKLKTKAE